MEISEAIEKRSSCRSYLNKEVKTNLIESILSAGLKAPNSGNIQTLRFIIVKTNGKKNLLADSCSQDWISEAPVLIVVLSDLNAAKSFYEDKAEAYCAQNAAVAIENILLMATSFELGSCWITSFDKNKMRAALKLDSGIKVEGLVTLGYPDKKEKRSKRFSLESSVYFEEWKNKQIKSLFPLKESLEKKLKLNKK